MSKQKDPDEIKTTSTAEDEPFTPIYFAKMNYKSNCVVDQCDVDVNEPSGNDDNDKNKHTSDVITKCNGTPTENETDC